MDEYRAKRVIAADAVRSALELHPFEWEDYPEIGESDWDDVLDMIFSWVRALERPFVAGEFKLAYDFLAARANQEEE